MLGDKGCARAFADDTAAVVDDLFGALPGIARLFDEYAAISGLFLNYTKTVIIPLWRDEERRHEDIRKLLAKIAGEWVLDTTSRQIPRIPDRTWP